MRVSSANEVLASQERRTENAGVVSQSGPLDLDLSGRIGKDLGSSGRPRKVDPRIAQGIHHAAADDHDLGPEDIDQPA